MGDSHVGRLYPYRSWLGEHLRGVSVRWHWRGGAGIDWAERQVAYASDFQIVVIMVGGNDIDNGMPIYRLADRLGRLAHDIIAAGAEAVVVTSLWPRSNNAYNTRARAFAHIMEQRFYNDPQVTFWLWDRRQSWRNYDGVHFTYHGYRQAMRYLISGIIWSINHNLW